MKKVKFEPYLETLTEVFYKTNSHTITENETSDLKEHMKELVFMESLELLKVFIFADGTLSHIQLNNSAIRYSYDQWISRKNALFNYLFGLTSGISVGVSVALIVSILGA